MSNKSGISEQVISLPKGGGALKGIGEKFSPDLFTGTGNFTVPIAIPPGRNGFQPQLNLVYSTGNGNGPFGQGWSLSVPGISRKTSKGVPRYLDADESDTFILSGAEDLVPVGVHGIRKRYRPRTDGLFAEIEHVYDPSQQEDFWEVHSKDGLVSIYGTPQLTGRNDPAAIGRNATNKFAWKLTETRDPFGNRIVYTYGVDEGDDGTHAWKQPQLTRIEYAEFESGVDKRFLVSVDLIYENREDNFSDYRGGFEIRTTKRCKSILIQTHFETTLKVRQYEFNYQYAHSNGVSLVEKVNIVGFDDNGNEVHELPPLTFGYTVFDPLNAENQDLIPITGTNPPPGSLGRPEFELADLTGDGLPDVLQMNGVVRYWKNMGQGFFDLPRLMDAAPSVHLEDPGVQMLDANGDGRIELMVTNQPLSGYFRLRFDGEWDGGHSFQRYQRAPSISLEDPETRLVDLDGDGVTDALRTANSLECYFNDARDGWINDRRVERRDLENFPNVNFSDLRVKLGDVTGDGLQDILLIHDGRVDYWPNLGYGEWGKRITMHNSPRFLDPGYPLGYDPRRILVGDVNGDGLADIVYVRNSTVCLWINQSGNAWSDEIVITGTPTVTDMDAVRLVDMLGSGISGVLWSSDFNGFAQHNMYFLDFTGGIKPYLLEEMDNHMGSVTRVEYAASTRFYLQDEQNPETRWKTHLPFPVQVVARVEVIDSISKGKLTTEYRYHHGYWDGYEREFRGFGMVEQTDTETFERYHQPGLHGQQVFNPVVQAQFSIPTLTKTWFHLGQVESADGEWQEVDWDAQYWPDDPQLLNHRMAIHDFLVPLPQSARRDALRTLRGSILRSELYTRDGSARQNRPYTVIEHAYALQEFAQLVAGNEARLRIFFPHLITQRTTQWERGDDPMTQFAFTGDYDAFGQPRHQTTVAMPRLARHQNNITGAVIAPFNPNETNILSTHARTIYVTSPANLYIYDRVAQVKTYELIDPPRGPDSDLDIDIQTSLQKQWIAAQQVRDRFGALAAGVVRLISHQLNHYDGPDFEGLAAGQLSDRGALMRSEVLVFTNEVLDQAYGDRRPDYLGGPMTLTGNPLPDFGRNIGYRKKPDPNSDPAYEEDGYYVDTLRQRLSARGLQLAVQDSLKHETTIQYGEYDFLPVLVIDAAGLITRATYNLRLLQPASMTEPNGNTTHVIYNPIGLPLKQYIVGLDVQGHETLGGTEQKPEISYFYDFLNFEVSGKPIFVKTIRRIQHASDNLSDGTLETYEYSDGYGRLIQTRAQAEAQIFGAEGDDVGLPAQPGSVTTPAAALTTLDRFVVSGWQVYDNKGRVVETYEPFFSQGWDFQLELDAKKGEYTTLFFDPRGQVIRTLNPDGSQQRVIFGAPLDPVQLGLTPGNLASTDVPNSFMPTPWESYTYDPNDLSGLTHPTAAGLPIDHRNTPANVIMDGMGRARCAAARNGSDPSTAWFVTRSDYDIRGNLVIIQDALGRTAFRHHYDLLNRPLTVHSIDAGLFTSVLDAQDNLIEYRDSKGSIVLHQYDELSRPTDIWAINDATLAQTLTLREKIIYGEKSGLPDAKARNLLGKPYIHYDEAGKLTFRRYDFKGNLLEKTRRTIKDEVIANGWQAKWEQPNAENALEPATYKTSSRYDALNRLTEVIYPQDVDGQRKKLTPHYNRGGALEAVQLGNDTYVERIAYNAKGQRVLIAYGNGLMTRYAYDKQTFRLARLRTERFSQLNNDRDNFQPGGAVCQDFTYIYDLAGNIITIDDRTPNCGIQNSERNSLLRRFTYDPIYRLLSATGRACTNIGSLRRGLDDDQRCGFHSAGNPATVTQDNAPELTERYTEEYHYDPAGNMLELNYHAGVTGWKRLFGMGDLPNERWKEAQNNRLTSLKNGNTSPAHSYQYDDNGNLTKQNTERHYIWDHADRMIRYEVQATPTSPASIQARYLYGADGMRVKKWVHKGNGSVHDSSTTYIDGVFEHHKWQEQGGGQNNRVQVMDNQGRIALVRVGNKHPSDSGPEVQYHLGDHLGSSAVVVGGDDQTGNDFINHEEYFPYGETSFGSFGKKRYRYSAKERDEESGLYYYGARYFGSGITRWISCDPIIFSNKSRVESKSHLWLSPFHYGFCNPLRVVDPSGMENVIIVGGGDISGKDTNKFVNTGLKAFDEHVSSEPHEMSTLVVMNIGLAEKTKEKLEKYVHEKGGMTQLIFLESSEQLNNYLNSGDPHTSIISEKRNQDLITDVWVFGHGYAYQKSELGPTFEPGHGQPLGHSLHDQYRWGMKDILNLDPAAFKTPNWRFETCNAATKNISGVDLVKFATTHTNGVGYGYRGKSDYSGIYSWPKQESDIFGPSDYYTKPGKLDDRSGPSQKIYYDQGIERMKVKEPIVQGICDLCNLSTPP